MANSVNSYITKLSCPTVGQNVPSGSADGMTDGQTLPNALLQNMKIL